MVGAWQLLAGQRYKFELIVTFCENDRLQQSSYDMMREGIFPQSMVSKVGEVWEVVPASEYSGREAVQLVMMIHRMYNGN